MSALAPIVARVVALMGPIADIGRVHDRLLLLRKGTETFEQQAQVTIGGVQRVRVWYVHLGQMPTSPQDAAGTMQWDRMIEIEGFFDFDNDGASSEATAVALAETVIRTLWADARTTSLGGTILFAKPGRIVDTNPRSFAGVICSYVRIEMPITTIELP